MSYDVKCGDLAAAFLQDVKDKIKPTLYADTVARLAQEIQGVIEDFMMMEGLDEDVPPLPQKCEACNDKEGAAMCARKDCPSPFAAHAPTKE